MKDFLSTLIERTAEFGNHYHKYIQAVSTYLNPLIQRLEEKKKRELVHIIHPTYDFSTALRIVADVSNDTKEKLNFLGTYFALQFLLVNHQAVDLLRMDVLESETNNFFIYKKFMRTVGNNFRVLTAHYIKELINIFMKTEECPKFVILGVGTKSDQDDIDVGIIDDGTCNREKFNKAISLVSQEMLKFAVSFHFHLSEHIGSHLYSASINEYDSVLKHEIRDFVIINEMLSGAIIIGNEQLYHQYQRRIINRYFYHSDGDNRYHEGYLRGILGEVSSLLARPLSATHINFKEDALRAIKGILSVRKTVFNIEKVNCWDIIDDLKAKDTNMYHEYNALERSLTFFEIFRYIYQLLVTQDEEVILEEISLKNIRRVARLLGYADIGKCRAEEHIIVHYYEHIQNIRKIIPVLLENTKKHLKLHSVFVPLFTTDYHGNIVQDFLRKFTFFRGTSFWDDILDDFKTEEFLKRFIDDLNSFQPDRRKKFIKGYVEWVKYDFYSLIQFFTILGKSKSGFLLFKDLNNHLLKIIDKIPEVERNIAYVFYRFPHLINSYLSLIEEDHLNHYLKILDRQIYEEEIASVVSGLESLIKIHLVSSHFFKNLFLKILDKHPESIRLLQKPQRLKEFAEGLYSDISSMRSFKEKKDKLGDYYDFEMLRVGISSLQGAPVQVTNTEYIEFSDRFIHTIFDTCRQEVDAEYKKRIITEDLLAIFAAGGHAREQAYDDDYDIIVLLNSDGEEILSYCNKIVSKMNSAIIKRGAIPHHRFADYFGRFVIRLKEIDQLLGEHRHDIFIEKSQILGARLIVGSHRFEKEFFEKIVKPHIFDQKEEYIKQMINEIHSRHTADKERLLPESNIKESSGGLRDIEMLMLIIKAKFDVREPVNSKLFELVASAQSNLKRDLMSLSEVLNFLKNLRDVYRLTVGATDTIIIEALHSPAKIMGYKSTAELFKKFTTARETTAQLIERVLSKLT